MNNFKVMLGDVNHEKDSFIKLEKEPGRFSFQMISDTGSSKGYCDLTPEEYEVFNNIFTRMANNVIREDSDNKRGHSINADGTCNMGCC